MLQVTMWGTSYPFTLTPKASCPHLGLWHTKQRVSCQAVGQCLAMSTTFGVPMLTAFHRFSMLSQCQVHWWEDCYDWLFSLANHYRRSEINPRTFIDWKYCSCKLFVVSQSGGKIVSESCQVLLSLQFVYLQSNIFCFPFNDGVRWHNRMHIYSLTA